MFIVVLGDGGVGKTGLTIQYCSNVFVEDYDPTIEDTHRKRVVVDEKPDMVDIFDSAANDCYPIPMECLRSCSAVLLLYSITSARSFDQLGSYIEAVHDIHDKRFPCVIVGCKSDLEQARQVELARAEELGGLLGYPVIETSAKHRINVDAAFAALIRLQRVYGNNLDQTVNNKRTK